MTIYTRELDIACLERGSDRVHTEYCVCVRKMVNYQAHISASGRKSPQLALIFISQTTFL